jgi:hypothetical protein
LEVKVGFHICEYCGSLSGREGNRFSHLSSGDTVLAFDSGRTWRVPDMILHYVADHMWLPPQDFVDDVMNSELVEKKFGQERMSISVGYLQGPFEEGVVPTGFVERLQRLMKKAADQGNRMQFRGG